MKRNNFLIGHILFVLCLISCSNDDSDDPNIMDEPNPVANCKIEAMTVKAGSNVDIYNISYNNEGKINKVTDPYGRSTWVYNDQTVVFSRFDDNNNLLRKLTIELNENGHPESIETSNSSITFTYNNQGELIEYVEARRNGTETTEKMTWSNGNMVERTDGTNSSVYEYYENQAVQQGDLFQLVWTLDVGISYFNNKNLFKSYESANYEMNIDYEYDQEGKITKLTVYEGTSFFEIEYEYTCN